LIQQKYFCLRPRPLEQWLWKQGVSASAERVFWLHWQQGMRRRDWCSEIALKHVADQCDLDVSSVTRAYQHLTKLGLLRRQDPGRDPARPFARAIAITEVRVPLELVKELHRYSDRSCSKQSSASNPIVAQAPKPLESSQRMDAAVFRDPFEGMNGRDRMRALSHLINLMSSRERQQYDEALRANTSQLVFDGHTKFTASQRETVLQFLAIVGRPPTDREGRAAVESVTSSSRANLPPRRLSAFELARIRREIQFLGVCTNTDDLLREVVWSVEEGALARFTSLHAIRIALKKIREKAWTRPNRMPPNWRRALADSNSHPLKAAHSDICRTA